MKIPSQLCGSSQCLFQGRRSHHERQKPIPLTSLDSDLWGIGKLALAVVTLFLLVLCSPASANGHDDESREPNHVSVLIGGTHVNDGDETAFTLGLDYEHRVTELLGLGFVIEHAFLEREATSILAVADIHVWRGFVIQVGPGVEFVGNEEYLLGRFGTLYELELGDHFTISPQIHYDFSEGEDAIVLGLAIGRNF
ncbi:MAG: hypothetical protein AAF251_05120 [Pseudomonadota bacterium]